MADLSAFSVPYYRSGSRKFRTIFAVGLALLVAPAAGAVTSTPGLFSNLSSVIEMVLILAGFGSLSTLFPIVFSPGAVRLEVTRSGVLLGTETVASRITGETSRQLGSRSGSRQLRSPTASRTHSRGAESRIRGDGHAPVERVGWSIEVWSYVGCRAA